MFIAFGAQADIMTGRVTRIYPNASGVSFQISAGCKAGTNFYYYFSPSTDYGKATYALLLSAATNKTTVNVAVAGACDSTDNQQITYVYQNY